MTKSSYAMPLSELMAITCREAGVRFEEVASRSRSPRVVATRCAYAKLCRSLPAWVLGFTTPSYSEISRAMGSPGHSTAITAAKRYDERPDAEATRIYNLVVLAIINQIEGPPTGGTIPGEFTSAKDAAAYLFMIAGYRLEDVTQQHYTDLLTNRMVLATLTAQATRKSEHASTAERVRRARAFIVQEGIRCASQTSVSSTSRTAS